MTTTLDRPRSAIPDDFIALSERNRQALTADASHTYLTGIHAPMDAELTLEDLSVIGAIPEELVGRYVRIGPNPIAPDPKGYHWFSGDGMLHGLAIKGGRALWYRNRWVRSTPVAAALGEPPAPGPRIGRHDNVNTNVIGLAGRTWAMVEAGSYPVSMSDSLDEQRYDPFGETLAGSFAAHPHRDPASGNLHAIAYEGGTLEVVRHVVVSPEGRVLRETPVTVEHGPSIHDCAITRERVVILDLPVTFSLNAYVGGQRFPFRWNEAHRARVGLLPFEGSDADVLWCDVDPCYVFHTGNAFENADGTVTLDVVAYERMFADGMQGPGGRTLGIERWRIDPSTCSVERRTIDATRQEFPRYNEALTGSDYRYLYTIATAGGRDDPAPTCVFKHDLQGGGREHHDFGPGHMPGEFVFVSARDGKREDDGWLIGLVIDTAAEATDLVFLDAWNVAAEPIARVRLPHRIPPGFHGNWIEAAA